MTNDEEMTKPKNSGNASASSSFNHYFDIRHSSFELRRVYGNVRDKERLGVYAASAFVSLLIRRHFG